MAYCRNCGNEINEGAPVCVNCGAPQNQEQSQVYSQPSVQEYTQEVKTESDDKGGFLWGLLGCCVPIAGLILFLVWKDTKPKTAKAAGIGALVCAICYVVFFILYFILIFALGIGIASMGF